ncbi:MAG: hypothetical protein ACREEX_10785, partial [Caulobacteraceae bacterium]
QRLMAARRAEILTSMATGLKSRPYEERGAIVAHLAPQLTKLGIAPSLISGFDPTDFDVEALAATTARLARTLQQPMAQGGLEQAIGP